MKQKFSILLIILFSGAVSFAQDNTEVNNLIRHYMDSMRITGLSIGIVKDGEILYSRGYGVTSVNSNDSISSDSYFLTASISKLITSTAIMQLAEQGKIDLNEKLITYLPSFKMKDARYKDITLYHLITHSSGLKCHHELINSPDDSAALSLYPKSFEKERLKFNPGEQFDGTTYSNAGYDLLGCVIENVSGLTFDEFVHKNILTPLQMTHSTYVHDTIPQQLKSLPQVLSGKSKEVQRFNLYGIIKDQNPVLKYPENPIVDYNYYGLNQEHNPSENFISSSNDLSKWMTHLLLVYNNSSNAGENILTHKTINEMWSFKRGIENKNTSIGLGWWRYPDEEFGQYVYHSGRHPGFSSIIMIFPEENLGMVILCNAKHADQLVWNHLPFEILRILKN